MIRVHIDTLEASRVALPGELVGLAAETLQNLQTAINPVPEHLLGVEFWPEEDQSQPLGENDGYGAETLTADPGRKIVVVVREVVPVAPAPGPRMISEYRFLDRFAADERIAIRGSVDPVVIDFRDLFRAAGARGDIDLDDPKIQAGLSYLESVGLLAAGRANEIGA